MATFSLSSIYWSFGFVAVSVVLGVFAVTILAILVLIIANIFHCCYGFCYNLWNAARDVGLPRTRDDVAAVTIYSDCSGAVDGAAPDDNACTICLDELEAGAEVRVLLRCKHTFHRSCIDQWLIGVRLEICPLCRDNVVDIEIYIGNHK